MRKKIIVPIFVLIFFGLVFINKKLISQAIIKAAHNGDLPRIKKEIEVTGAHGINERYAGRGGRTLLHFACESEKTTLDIVKFLVDKGASLAQEDFVGTTPLLSACSNPNSNISIVQYLITKGARVNDRCIEYASNNIIERYAQITQKTDTDDYRKALRIIGNKISQREPNYDYLMYPIADAIQRILYNLSSLHKSIMYNLFYAIKLKKYESAYKEYFSDALKIEKHSLDFDKGFINFLKNIIGHNIKHPFINLASIPKALEKLHPSTNTIIAKIKSDNINIYRDYILISIMDVVHNILRDENITLTLQDSIFNKLYQAISPNPDLREKVQTAFANALSIDHKDIDFSKKMPVVLKDILHEMRYINPHPLFTDEPHGSTARKAYDKLQAYVRQNFKR